MDSASNPPPPDGEPTGPERPGPGRPGPTAPGPRPAAVADPGLRRVTNGRILGGVAAGLAEHFDVDVVVVRMVLVGLTLVGFVGVALYLAGWLLIPEEGTDVSAAEEVLGSLWTRSAG